MATRQLLPRPSAPTRMAWFARVKELRVARAELNIKWVQMARDLGKNVSHIRDVVRGDQQPSEKLAREIADYLGKPLESLFFQVDLENPKTASAA